MPQKSKTQTRQRWGREQKLTVFTGVVVIVFVILAIAYQQWNLNNPSSSNSESKVGSDFRLDKQPALGANSAKVKVVEFGDYKCPACQRFEAEVFPRLKSIPAR
jgi:preprotein translocase subunit SecG